MKHIMLGTLVVVIVLSVAGCGVTMPVRTLPKGTNAIALSAGFIHFPSNTESIPTFPVAVQYAYGVDDAISVTASLTNAIGLGTAVRAWRQNGTLPEFTIALHPGYQVFPSSRDGMSITWRSAATASWDIGSSVLCYGALRHDQIPSEYNIVSPAIGFQTIGSVGIQIEVRNTGYDFINASSSSRPSFVLPNGGIFGLVYSW